MEETNIWLSETIISSTMTKLNHSLEHIRKCELARHSKKMSLIESEKMEKITRGFIQSILNHYETKLSASIKKNNIEQLSFVICKIFGLEDDLQATGDEQTSTWQVK